MTYEELALRVVMGILTLGLGILLSAVGTALILLVAASLVVFSGVSV